MHSCKRFKILVEAVIIYLANQMIWHKNTFSRDRVFAIFACFPLLRQAISEVGTRSDYSRNAPLTTIHLPMKGESWLHLMLPKRQGYTKPCPLSIWPLLESSSTFTRYRKPDCLNRKRQGCFPVSRKNCKRNSTNSFSKTYTSLSLTIGTNTEKRGNAGKSISAILMTFSFTPKSAKSSLPNNARNANSLTS
jgi:hypothetical protein